MLLLLLLPVCFLQSASMKSVYVLQASATDDADMQQGVKRKHDMDMQQGVNNPTGPQQQFSAAAVHRMLSL